MENILLKRKFGETEAERLVRAYQNKEVKIGDTVRVDGFEKVWTRIDARNSNKTIFRRHFKFEVTKQDLENVRAQVAASIK